MPSHFEGDPVMPGCLGLDALWQLVGFHLVWSGYPGRGRALGVGKVKFTGQVLQKAKLVTYQLDIKRVISRKLTMAIASLSLSLFVPRVFFRLLPLVYLLTLFYFFYLFFNSFSLSTFAILFLSLFCFVVVIFCLRLLSHFFFLLLFL